MPEEPHYQSRPHTLDANREIPEDAAPSAGHTADQAEEVKAADEEFTENMKEVSDAQADRDREAAEAGAQKPSERALGESPAQPQTDDSDDSDSDSDDVPDGTVQEVLDWVGDDSDRAQRALQTEKRGQNRSSLVSQLESKVC